MNKSLTANFHSCKVKMWSLWLVDKIMQLSHDLKTKAVLWLISSGRSLFYRVIHFLFFWECHAMTIKKQTPWGNSAWPFWKLDQWNFAMSISSKQEQSWSFLEKEEAVVFDDLSREGKARKSCGVLFPVLIQCWFLLLVPNIWYYDRWPKVHTWIIE